MRRSGEGEKGRCLPWSKEEEGAYIFWMKQVPVVTVLENVMQCDGHAANLRYLAQANATNKLWPNVVINRKLNPKLY